MIALPLEIQRVLFVRPRSALAVGRADLELGRDLDQIALLHPWLVAIFGIAKARSKNAAIICG